MKKKKKKQQNSAEMPIANEKCIPVLLGVRVTEAERQKIKMYAVQHGTTVTQLIRQYIDSL